LETEKAAPKRINPNKRRFPAGTPPIEKKKRNSKEILWNDQKKEKEATFRFKKKKGKRGKKKTIQKNPVKRRGSRQIIAEAGGWLLVLT